MKDDSTSAPRWSQSASLTAFPPPSYFCAHLHFLQQFPAFPHYLILRPYLFVPLCRYFHPTLSIYFWGGEGDSSPPPAKRLINSHLCLSPTIHQKGHACTNVHSHAQGLIYKSDAVLFLPLPSSFFLFCESFKTFSETRKHIPISVGTRIEMMHLPAPYRSTNHTN